MYGSKTGPTRKVGTCRKAWLVRMSKNVAYESPYVITGDIKQAGSERRPKGICIDRTIGTWEYAQRGGLNPKEALAGKAVKYNLPLCAYNQWHGTDETVIISGGGKATSQYHHHGRHR